MTYAFRHFLKLFVSLIKIIYHCRRCPGLFKTEHYVSGANSGQICLSSKTYCIFSPENTKVSCKSAQKDKLPPNPEQLYKLVLDNQQSQGVKNKGFIFRDGHMYTYSMDRKSFSYFYVKRVVANNGTDTSTLDLVLRPVDTNLDEA